MGLPQSSCGDWRPSTIQYTFTWNFVTHAIPSVIKDFSPLKFRSYVMIHGGLSWQTFHVHLKNKTILLLGVVFCKHQFGQDCCILISYLIVPSITERAVARFPATMKNLPISPFSCLFLFNYVEVMLLGTSHTFMSVRSSE